MRNLILALLTFVCLSAFTQDYESDLKELLPKLAEQDFEVRQEATDKLSQFPVEYIQRFLRMSMTEKDAEVGYRLECAAHAIFSFDMRRTDQRILRLQTTIDIEAHLSFFSVENTNDSDECKHYLELLKDLNGEDSIKRYFAGSKVDSVSPIQNKLSEWDIIIKIDGVYTRKRDDLNIPMDKFGFFDPGTVVTLTVIRFRDINALRQRGCPLFEKDKFDIVEVPIIPRIDNTKNLKQVWDIIDTEWKNMANKVKGIKDENSNDK